MPSPSADFHTKTARQLTAWLPNEPGQMAKLGRALKRARINILAMSVHDGTEVSAVRLVLDDPKAGAEALLKTGLHYAMRDVLLVTGRNVPGVLGDIGAKLAKADVNLQYAYASAHPAAPEALLVVAAANIRAARRALE